jgi:hypothetical protein
LLFGLTGLLAAWMIGRFGARVTLAVGRVPLFVLMRAGRSFATQV